MEKIHDFYKKHPFAAINIAGILLILLTFLLPPLAALATLAYWLIAINPFLLVILIIIPVILIIIFIAVKIAAFFGVYRKDGAIFSAKVIITIFLIEIWFAIWLVSWELRDTIFSFLD